MGLHSAIVQVVVVGCIAFTCPGLFNALSGLGKAGGKDADPNNMAMAALYTFFAVFGYFGGPLFNIFGNKVLMFVGGLTYATYAAGMYIAGNVEGTVWVAVLVGALLGIGAGIFWTAQGAMMLAYSTPFNKGRYIGIFWIIFNLGGLVGGLLSLALNWKSDDGQQANPASYFTFVGLMAAGAFASLIFLVKPDTVVKEDGTTVEMKPAGSVWEEIKGALRVATNKYMLFLATYFVFTNWNYPYQFNFINGTLFNIRTRGFNSAVYWGSQMFAAYLIGKLLDRTSISRKRRALTAYALGTLSYLTAFICAIVIQLVFEGAYDKDNLPEFPIDLTESSRCALPLVTLALFGWADALTQAFAYWIMGAVAGDDLGLIANFAGFYKGVQSAGAAVSWALDLRLSYLAQLWVTMSVWALGTLLAIFAVKDVKEDSTPNQKSSSQVSIAVLDQA